MNLQQHEMLCNNKRLSSSSSRFAAPRIWTINARYFAKFANEPRASAADVLQPNATAADHLPPGNSLWRQGTLLSWSMRLPQHKTLMFCAHKCSSSSSWSALKFLMVDAGDFAKLVNVPATA